MDAAPYEFLKKYGDIATVQNIKFAYESGFIVHDRNGWDNVAPQQYITTSSRDLVVNYEIDNPGDFAISASLGVAGVENPDAEGIKISVNSNTSLSVTYPAAFIDSRNMDYGGSGDISPKIFLTRVSDNYGQSYDTRAIRVNAPPPSVYNAISQILSGDGERMIICFVLPDNIPNDVNYFSIVDERKNTVHEFGFSNGSITVGTEDKGWKIDTVSPGTLEPTWPDGPVFDPTGFYSGTPYYVTTDVKNILSLDIFYLRLVLRDQAGLEGMNYVPSRVQMLDPLTCNIPETAYMLENTFDQPYIELTVNPPANAPDATLYLNVRDADDNVIADINGNTETCDGATTFHLYPEIDGQSKYYYVSIYASKPGWMSGGGVYRSLYISGKQLDAPVADPDPSSAANFAQDTVVTVTSPQNADLTWTGSTHPLSTDPSPVEIKLEKAGANNFAFFAEKEYYQSSGIVSLIYNVVATKVYVQSGAPASGTGTRDNPVPTIDRAMNILDANGAADKSANTIYIMGDFLNMTGSITVGNSSDYYNIVGVDSNGETIQPVELRLAANGSVIDLSTGTLALRHVKITNVTAAANGAVRVTGGTFIIKDHVTIFGNPCGKNVHLASGQVITINQSNLSGTKVGVNTAVAPAGGIPVPVTSGYAASGVTDDPSDHFVSDTSGQSVIYNTGKTDAVLAVNGGSIDIGDIASVSFAAAGSAGVYTVTASATSMGGTTTDITSEVTAWSLKLYYLNTYTGMTSATNTMDLSALADGTYIMKISAVYGGSTYSGEVEIDVSN